MWSCCWSLTATRLSARSRKRWSPVFPFTSFAVDDATAEFERLRAAGVRFVQEPTAIGSVTLAVFDDTCGNLIAIGSESRSSTR